MASSRSFLHFIFEQLDDLEDVAYLPLDGDFVLYYRGIHVGGIYGDRLFVKPFLAAMDYMPDAPFVSPTENTFEYLLVENVNDKEFLQGLFKSIISRILTPKTRKKKRG